MLGYRKSDFRPWEVRYVWYLGRLHVSYRHPNASKRYLASSYYYTEYQ